MMSINWKGQAGYIPGALIGGALLRIGWEIGGWVWLKLVS
jgi:hypothetical protein